MKNYKYILWDLDGTVTDTYEGISNCLKYAFNAYNIKVEGKEITDDTDFRKFVGPPLRVSFPMYTDCTEEQVEVLIAKYRERYIPVGVYECELFPGVTETIRAFKEAGKIQALASSKPEAQCRDVLEKFGLLEYFDEVVGSTPDGGIDTKLEVLNEVFRRLEIKSKEEAVLLGDTHFDADGAKEAGIDCIGVNYGFGTKEELLDSGAIEIFDDQEKLRKALL